MKLLHRQFAAAAIRINEHGAHLVKGKIRSSGVRDVAAVCRAAGVTKGEIWIDGLERVTCSREIPEAIRQRLRNCLTEALRG